jgi:hypothetical protein
MMTVQFWVRCLILYQASVSCSAFGQHPWWQQFQLSSLICRVAAQLALNTLGKLISHCDSV